MFNLATDLQSLKILFLPHTLFKSSYKAHLLTKF